MFATPAQIQKMNELGLQIMYDSQTTVEEARQIIIDNSPKKISEVERSLAILKLTRFLLIRIGGINVSTRI